MDKFVEGLRAEGAHDSEGVFTMAVQEASWKLAAYRLAQPQSYACHVVASAVAGVASRLSIVREPQAVEFCFDGPPYSQQELDLLRLPVLGESVPRRVRELAIAISAAGAIGSVRFSSVGPQGSGWQLEVVGQNATLSSAHEPYGQRLAVFAPLSEEAVGLLKERGRFAPIELTVDRASIRCPVDFGVLEEDYHGYYLLQGATDLVVRSPTVSSRKFFTWTGPAGQGVPTLHLALTSQERASAAGLTLIADGLAYRLDTDALGLSMPFFCGAVCANGLRKDISQTGFVHNAEYEELLELVRQKGVEFVDLFCQAPTALPSTMLQAFRHHLESVNGAGRASVAVGAFLKRTEVTARRPQDNAETLIALGEAAAASGDFQQYHKVVQMFRAELVLVRQSALTGRSRGRRLLEREALLHRSSGIEDPTLLELRAVWEVIADGEHFADASSKGETESSDSQLWATRLLADEIKNAGPASRYRAQLILLPEVSWESVVGWLEVGEVEPEWTVLIEYVALAQQRRWEEIESLPSGRLKLPLRALALAAQGDTEQSLEVLLQLADGAGPGRGYWREVAFAITAGKVSFSSWVSLRASLSLLSLVDSWRLYSAYRDWRGMLSASAVKEIPPRTLARRLLGPAFLPLLIYRLYLSNSAGEAFSVLSPALLQKSLGPAGSPLLDLATLPEARTAWDVGQVKP